MGRIGKRFVYILRSERDPARHYVGITSNVDERLEWHNHGPCGYTLADRPWSVVVTMEFRTEAEAVRFEKYRKSGSGRAFAKRHFGADSALSNVSPSLRSALAFVTAPIATRKRVAAVDQPRARSAIQAPEPMRCLVA